MPVYISDVDAGSRNYDFADSATHARAHLLALVKLSKLATRHEQLLHISKVSD